MLLSQIGEIDLYKSEKFNAYVKNGKFYFNLNNVKYQIGTKLFPVGKKAHLFYSGNTFSDSKYSDIARTIEGSNITFEMGKCYTNAEILYEIFKGFGYDAKYYSGWVFNSANLPVHHAWVVIDDSVFDVSLNVRVHERMYELSAEGKNLRDYECVKEIARLSKDQYPIDKVFVWGNSKYHLYVGAESTPDLARKQYNNCIESVNGIHPAYQSLKGVKHDLTPFQKAIKNHLGE